MEANVSLITPLIGYARIRLLLPTLLHPHGASILSSLNPRPPPAAPAHRLRAATWINGRTALGACLILLAVLAGTLFLDRSQRLVPVYAAAHDLPAGAFLKDGEIVLVVLPARGCRSSMAGTGRCCDGRTNA
jgi:hypothetical protein